MTNVESFNHKYQNHHIVLFDGVCNLCESSVNFIIKHDTQQQFHFMAQSTQEAQEFLKASQGYDQEIKRKTLEKVNKI